MIRKGDERVVQLYLSLFTVSRLIADAPKITKNLFSSLTDPYTGQCVDGLTDSTMRTLLERYVPRISSMPLKQGIEFVPTWKSVPSASWYSRSRQSKVCDGEKNLRSTRPTKSLFTCFFSEFAAFAYLIRVVRYQRGLFYNSMGVVCTQGLLYPPFYRYPFDPNNEAISNWSLEWFDRRIEPITPMSSELGIPAITGLLCQTLSGDGKRRLFAIGNYINQRLLYPFHELYCAPFVRMVRSHKLNHSTFLKVVQALHRL